MNDIKLLISNEDPRNQTMLSAFLNCLTERKDIITSLNNEVLAVLMHDEIEDVIMISGDYLMSIEEVVFGITSGK